MNFLGHFYLSGLDEELIIGNFLGDFIRGKEMEKLPKKIQKGVQMHREIDVFTDHHSYVVERTTYLRKTQKKYAPVVMDMLLDYLLASEWERWSDIPLDEYSKKVYSSIEKGKAYYPPKGDITFYYMQKHNWLYAYQFPEGIQRALSGLGRRASFGNTMSEAWKDYLTEEKRFKEGFEDFFMEAKKEFKHFLG